MMRYIDKTTRDYYTYCEWFELVEDGWHPIFAHIIAWCHYHII